MQKAGVLAHDSISLSLSGGTDGEDEHRTLTSAVHARLRSKVISCQFRPGEKLPIAALSKSFKVSYAVMREALSRLVADGLVVAEDQRGFRASPLSLADLQDLTHTRVELECLALRRSMARGDATWRQQVEQAWQALDAVGQPDSAGTGPHQDAWSVLHGRFHASLVRACGLDWLLRFRAILYEQSERYRMLARMLRTEPREVEAEHRGIFLAVMERDTEAAVARLAVHLQRTADDITTACASQGLPESLGGMPAGEDPAEGDPACST